MLPYLLKEQHPQINFIIRGFHIFKKLGGMATTRSTRVWTLKKKNEKSTFQGDNKNSVPLVRQNDVVELTHAVRVPEKSFCGVLCRG